MSERELHLGSPENLLDLGPFAPLRDGVFQLWALQLEAPDAIQARYFAVLSAAEREKAGRFHFERDRRHYVFARGGLRLLLAAYTGSDAATLDLQAAPNGKPFLDRGALKPISFNLSHSGGRALFAFGSGAEVGVDLEQHRQIDAKSIAGSYFWGASRESILAAAAPELLFYRHWTAKEAVMKACGEGFRLPLDQFDVALGSMGEVAPVRLVDACKLDRNWFVRELPTAAGWSAAICARGTEWQVELMPAPR